MCSFLISGKHERLLFTIRMISSGAHVSLDTPVIASSGAGSAQHFVDVSQETDVEATLAAGIFHRQEVPVSEVKEAMRRNGIETR
jgi:imidazole glycerol phosphate synthase subunit HisF